VRRVFSERDGVVLLSAKSPQIAMHVSLIDYILWFASPLLQAGVLVALFRRGLYREYPYFFSYVILQVVSITFLLLAQRSVTLYVSGYWVINAVSILISLGIIQEIFKEAFRPYEDLRDLGAILSRWLALVFVLCGCMCTITSIHSAGRGSITAVVLLTDLSVRLMQCGLGFFILLLSGYLGISRRHVLYGIALGFGLFTSVNMLVAMGMSHPSTIHASVLGRINLTACDLAALIWLGYTALALPPLRLRPGASKPIVRPLIVRELSELGSPRASPRFTSHRALADG